MKNKMFFWIDFLGHGTKTTMPNNEQNLPRKGKKVTFGSRERIFSKNVFSISGNWTVSPPLSQHFALSVHVGLGEG